MLSLKAKTTAKHKIANQLVSAKNIFVSTQVINEVCTNLLKKAALDEQKIRDMIVSFYNSCTVLEFNYTLLLKASELRSQFWDSLIVSTALYAQTTFLISEDMQHGLIVEQSLEIINPFQ